MRNRSRGAFAVLGMLVLALLGATGANAAERFYGVTYKDQLVTLNSDSPGVFRSREPIKGLLGRDKIIAIDLDPSNGRLYGLSTNSRVYTIAARSGRARPVGGPFSPRLGSQDVGFDFNPVADNLRVVTGSGSNFRVDPVTGRLVDGDSALTGAQGDGDLRYEANDPAGSSQPRVVASAYSGGQLFGIDAARNTLVLQDPANGGVLNTVGRLRINAGGPVGFDIAKGDRPYASFTRGGKGPTGLFRISIANGRATPAARFNAVGVFARADNDGIRTLTAAGPAKDDNSRPRVRNRKLNDPRVSQLLTRERVLRLQVGCTEACVVVSQLVLGRRVVGGATGGVPRGGRTVLRLRLSDKGRRIVRRVRPKLLAVGIAAADAAGNTVRSSRFQR